MAFSHLIFAAASAAQPAQFAGVPLAAAEQIFQIELHRLPPEALKPLLFDADPRIRVRAVVAAGRLQAPTLLLAGLVADGEPTVRLAAVQALGFAPDAAALLRSRLSVESNPLVVGGILESLGRVGEAEDVAAVVVALQSPPRSHRSPGPGPDGDAQRGRCGERGYRVGAARHLGHPDG